MGRSRRSGPDRAYVGAVRLIQEVWEELLGFGPIELQDRFFDLGGTSLLAEQMLTRLRAGFISSLSAADLLGDPDVNDLAGRMMAARRRRFRAGSSTAVTLRESLNGGPAVFCVSGAGATALGFLPLTATLPAETAVHAFQAAGLESRAMPDWTVARAARRHLRDVRRLQPTGPYVLVGHSFGGHIATEMARALIASGEDVAGIYLLDTLAAADSGGSVADRASDAGRPSLTRRQRWATHRRVYTVGLRQLQPDLHREAMWEQAIRVQNRHEVRSLPANSAVYVTDENSSQRRHWHSVSPDTVLIEVPGDHHGVLHDPPVVHRVVTRILADLARAGETTGDRR